jgi:hypothetical protein
MDLQKAISTNLHFYKNLQKKIDAHNTKATSITLRKQWLEKQKVNNYINEYDRIRGILSQSVLGTKNTTQLEKRKSDLEKLGAKAIHQIV